MRRNTITRDRYQLLSARLRRSQIVTIATAAHRRVRAFIAVFIPTVCNSGIIDRHHCEIHKPTARFIAPPLPPPFSSPTTLAPGLAFCDRRLTPRRYRRRDDIRPRSGIAPDKSCRRCFVFLFLSLSFALSPLSPDDRFVAKLFTRKLKSGDEGESVRYAMLMMF